MARIEPRPEDVDQARVRGDVAQMGVVAADQGLVDDRQPGQRLGAGVVEQFGHRAVQEAEELHAPRRTPPVARRGAAAVAAAVDRRVAAARLPAQVAHLDESHRGRHHRGHRSRHPPVLRGLEPDRAGAHQRERLVEVVRPALEHAGHGGGVQHRRDKRPGSGSGRPAVQQRMRFEPDRLGRGPHAGPGGLDGDERFGGAAVGFGKHGASVPPAASRLQAPRRALPRRRGGDGARLRPAAAGHGVFRRGQRCAAAVSPARTLPGAARPWSR